MVTSKPTIVDLRRENLRRLIRDRFHNSPTDLATEMGYSNGSFIVQMTGPHPSRQISEKTARRIEEKLSLPERWLDMDHGHQVKVPGTRNGSLAHAVHTGASPGAPIPSVGADTPLVADVVRLVGQVMDEENVRLPAAKLADIVALAWTDTLEHQGKPRESYVRDLMKLVKG